MEEKSKAEDRVTTRRESEEVHRPYVSSNWVTDTGLSTTRFPFLYQRERIKVSILGFLLKTNRVETSTQVMTRLVLPVSLTVLHRQGTSLIPTKIVFFPTPSHLVRLC